MSQRTGLVCEVKQGGDQIKKGCHTDYVVMRHETWFTPLIRLYEIIMAQITLVLLRLSKEKHYFPLTLVINLQVFIVLGNLEV